MTGLYVDAPHVVRWRETHASWLVGVEKSAQFAAVVNQLPWNSAGTRLDWSVLEGVELDVEEPDWREAMQHARLGGHTHVFVLYSPKQPGLIGRTDDVIESLFQLYRAAAGPRYICGAHADDREISLAFEDLAEWDGIETLTLRV